MNRITRALPLVAALLLTASAAAAQARDPNRGHAHDPGNFFMRLSAGFGFSSAAFDDPFETKLSGGGGMGDFAFGATIAPNIAIHADLFGLSIVSPNVEFDGEDIGDADNTRATVGAIGVGASFYVMPLNLYFSAAVGAAVGTFETRFERPGIEINLKDETKVGFALNVMVGKEWWVSRRWGIGIAAELIFAGLETDPERGEGVDLGVFGVGLLFTATMN